ncbi:MAG: DUF3800 domain-containing protein [Candidatus Gracilibacteria bacterium]|nr:DUF3800 domain-containing protein [Candidatus Gracilibacteria bacterium]
MNASDSKTLHIFIDEGGDRYFTESSSKYFTLTAVACMPDSATVSELYCLRKELFPRVYEQSKSAEKSTTNILESFHASEDFQFVRDRVFEIIEKQEGLQVFSVIIEKRKTNPSLQDISAFYTKACIWLMHGLLYNISLTDYNCLIIYFDGMPIKVNKKKAMFKGIKLKIAEFFREKKISVPYYLVTHQSKADVYLQIVDYVNWAIFIKNERGEIRPYEQIKKLIKNEFYPFATGTTFFY